MRCCVWSRNLKNEGAMARVGPQRHRKQKQTMDKSTGVYKSLKDWKLYSVFPHVLTNLTLMDTQTR